MSSEDPSIRTIKEKIAEAFPRLLSRMGILDQKRGTDAFNLALPVIFTGGLRVALRLTDLSLFIVQ